MAAAAFRIVALALLSAACTSIDATRQTFEGTRWRATAVDSHSLAPGERLTLQFGPFYSSAIGSCNTRQSHYRVSERMIVFEGGTTTERGCEAELMAFDERAFAILTGPVRMNWTSGRQLTLVKAVGTIDLELAR
jgi:heat shock protein HslJ